MLSWLTRYPVLMNATDDMLGRYLHDANIAYRFSGCQITSTGEGVRLGIAVAPGQKR